MQRVASLFQVFLIVMATFAALKLAGLYPFYYSWDMDLTIVQDMLLLQNDQLPTHYIHPGYGMYFFLYWVHHIAQVFDFITPVNISNLGDARQPLLIVAEQVDFLRQTNAIFCIFLAIILWTALAELLPGSNFRKTLLLAVCLLMPCLWKYDITLIRTETYSMIFWTLAILMTVLASQEVKDEKKHRRFIYFLGAFCAASLFTKIQAIFLIAIVPFIYFLLRPPEFSFKSSQPFPTKKFVYGFLALSILTIVFIFPDHLHTFRNNWLPNRFFAALCFLIYLMAAVQSQKKWTLRFLPQFQQWLEFFKNFILGSCLVLFLPFFSPLNLWTSLNHSLFTFKVIFLRHSYISEIGDFSLLNNLVSVLTKNVFLLSLFAVTILGLIVFYSLRKQIEKRIYVIMIASLFFLHVCLAIRDSQQDFLWLEFPVILLVVIGLSQFKARHQILPFVLLVLFQVMSITSMKNFKRSPEMAYNNPELFFKEVYKFDLYRPIFDSRYKTLEKRNDAIQFASNWSLWKSMLIINFPDNGIDLRDIDSFQEGIEVRFKLNDRLNYQATMDRTFSIVTPAEIKNQIHSGRCVKDREQEIEISGRKLVQVFYRSDRKDIWTGHYLSDLCQFTGLDLSQQKVALSSKY